MRVTIRSCKAGLLTVAAAAFAVVFIGFANAADGVGAETCLACHSDIRDHFKNDVHSSIDILKGGDEGIKENACEACHGNGAKHVESGGNKRFIERKNAENCFACHMDIQAKFKLQHHHPVSEGRLFCTDCHSLHGSGARTDTIDKLRGGRDTACLKCHKEVKGPYVFEHDAMREGCKTCHNPHGSVQDKMLVAGQTTTCLRCHYDVTTNARGDLGGGVAHGGTASVTGKPGGNYDIGRGEECVDHHRAPHGSNIWRTLNR